MVQYIDKSTLMAEIEKRKETFETSDGRRFHSLSDQILWNAFNSIQDIINALEVKEVDLDFMLHEYWDISPKITIDCLESATMTKDEMVNFAKHFFELGLRNALTVDDLKLIWDIGDEIPNMPDEEFFFDELLKRFKEQKGGKV